MRTPRSRTTAAFSANCSSSSSRRPNSLSSIAPPTLNRSVIELPRSALPCIWSRVSPTSRLPTQRDEMNRIGNVARHSSVTCQLSAIITTPTKTTLIMLETVRRQRGGERPLRADHVVVEPRHQRAGLGAGEEGQRHALHVGEHARAQVEDEALPDAGGQPAHADREPRVEDCHARGGERQADDQRGVLLEDAVVDDLLDQQRGHHDERGVDDGQRQEERDRAAVRLGEADDASDGVRGQLLLGDAAVGAHVTPHRTHAGSHGHLLTSSCVTPPAATPGRGTCAPAPRARRAAGRPGSCSDALCSSALVSADRPVDRSRQARRPGRPPHRRARRPGTTTVASPSSRASSADTHRVVAQISRARE